MLGDSGIFDRPAEQYVPYAGHISDDVVLLMDGSVLACLRLTGSPFQLEGTAARNARHERINTLLRNIADDNVTVHAHLIRSIDGSQAPHGEFTSAFAQGFHRSYQQAVLDGRLSANSWIISIVVSPRAIGQTASTLGRLLRGKTKARIEARPQTVRQLQDIVSTIAATLSESDPVRLSIREKNGVAFTEIGEAMHLIRTAVWRPVPIVSGSLGASIYTDRVICARRAFQIRIPGRAVFGAMLSFREYPARTRPGMLNDLLSAPYPLVLSQSFAFTSRAAAQAALTLKQNQMQTAGDKALSQIAGLSDAMDDVASNVVAVGIHNFSLAVYAGSPAELEGRVSDASTRITNAGAVACVEELGLEACYWSQLPGVTGWHTRPGKISTRNFAGLCSFDGFPAGNDAGFWGPALMRFRTQGGTAYDYVPHVADVGHTLVIGRTGTGKTVFLCMLMAALEQATHTSGTIVFFDKDRGGELLVRARGGRYLPLRRGTASGLAPLRALPDNAESAAFLHSLFTGLIVSDGGEALTPDEDGRLRRGIARQMKLPMAQRSMLALRAFLGQSADGAGARFERWCQGGTLGWLFDNDDDLVALDAPLVGFDMTELLPRDDGMADDGASAAAASYLMHRIRALMDGRRMAVVCDECRFYMPALARVLEDLALTGRKKDVMLVMAAQQPEHILSHAVGASLLSQCQTKILFPNPSADRAAYIGGLKITEAAFQQITGDMTIGAGRCFMLWREAASVILEFDLSGLPDEIAILSGREKTIRLMDRVRADLGTDDPDQILPEFTRRRRLLAAP